MKGTVRYLLALLILGAAAEVQAQFEHVTNADGTSLTVTGYSGSDAVIIPPAINGLTVTGIGQKANPECL
jgi:hypothetical protein